MSSLEETVQGVKNVVGNHDPKILREVLKRTARAYNGDQLCNFALMTVAHRGVEKGPIESMAPTLAFFASTDRRHRGQLANIVSQIITCIQELYALKIPLEVLLDHCLTMPVVQAGTAPTGTLCFDGNKFQVLDSQEPLPAVDKLKLTVSELIRMISTYARINSALVGIVGDRRLFNKHHLMYTLDPSVVASYAKACSQTFKSLKKGCDILYQAVIKTFPESKEAADGKSVRVALEMEHAQVMFQADDDLETAVTALMKLSCA